MPDTAEYLARIRGYAQSGDPLDLQGRTPEVIAALIAGATHEQLRERPGKDKWSIGEILAHLTEDEIATAWRYRQMVEHDGTDLAGFDQDMRICCSSTTLAGTVGAPWEACGAWPHYG